VRRVFVDYRNLDKKTVARLIGEGISVGAWTVNQPNQLRKLARWGVGTIITDRPLLARKILGQI
jgi:glycerophosphoryl diester phosphodiesterase